MTIKAFHDLVCQLKEQEGALSIEEGERKQYLNELIESLETQILSEQGIQVEGNILMAQLEDKLLHFEVEHPDISAILSNIINSLKNMGI